MLQIMKHLGIDYGTKRIGVAVSDDTGSVAFPLTTVVAGREALEQVAALVREHVAEKIVIGESKNFKNEPNLVMEDIEQFKKDIAELTQLPVVYEPELFSSAQAARQHEDRTQPRRPASGAGVPTKASGDKLDAAAAALILQSYLDRHRAV